MNKYLKYFLDFFKPAVDAELAQLKANRDANIAAIEASVGSGVNTVEGAVTAFLAKSASHGALAIVVPFFEGPLLGYIAQLVQQGANTVPALYDEALAFLEKEESYL